MKPFARQLAVLSFGLVVILSSQAGYGLEGSVKDPDGKAISGVFCALLNESYGPVVYGNTDGEGRFRLDWQPEARYLVTVPPRSSHGPGVHAFAYHPRVFELAGDGTDLALTLPQAVNFILHGYDSDGKLLLWEDYAAMGQLGGQFIHGTDLNYTSIPATRWHVPRPDASIGDDSRERSLPAVLLAPGGPAALELLFWETQGYGKLLLRMDNGGQGFDRSRGGAHQVLEVNVELARTAVADLLRRASAFLPEDGAAIEAVARKLQEAQGQNSPEARAKAADAVLVEALGLRDELEVARAKRSGALSRSGSVHLRIPEGDTAAGELSYTLKPLTQDFLFGVYEGAPYHARAWEAAREGGFQLATVLLGWNWTQNPKSSTTRSAIERQYGLKSLEELGYLLKSHGVVWVQEYPIMPQNAATMEHPKLMEAKLEHAEALLEVFGDRLAILENINEPANTNVAGLSREDMAQLATRSAALMKKFEKPVLVNSPHEFTHGWQFVNYGIDGEAVDHFPRSFGAYLDEAGGKGELRDVDIIGLQVYPGGHFNTPPFEGLDTPAFTPSRIQDLLDSYSRFNKTLHITEFSLPSRYEDHWKCGYWQNKWDESLQAAYAEAVFAIAYAHPLVRSISWWDISDKKPSVASGGLLRADNTAKPAFEAVTALIGDVQAPREGRFSGSETRIQIPGGRYALSVKAADGRSYTEEFQIIEGFTKEIQVTW